jgi:hypothetical protein
MLGLFGNTTGVLSAKLNDAKTRFDATSVSGALSGAKSVIGDLLSEALKNPIKKLIEIAKTQIKEIERFLTTETETKLNAFIENHKSVVGVINAFKVNIKSLNGDTNRSVECSYYETYEDIGINKITKSSLTLQEAEEKRALQKTYCDKLFQDNAIELRVISNHLQTISKNINSLLQKISENRDNTDIVNELTPLLNKLQEYSYNGMLSKYSIVFKCGEYGKGLVKSKGGGSYKKTKRTKKINALNRGMRGGGVVEEQLIELETFFVKHKGLEDLLQKRIVLDVVLFELKRSIDFIFIDENKEVICEYYESYENIGTDNITKSSLTLSGVKDKYNLQIGFRDDLIKEIEKIKTSISKEEIDGIRRKYKDYKASLEKLLNDISIIDNSQSFTVKSLFGVTSAPLKKQKIKLLKFLKQLEYLFETKSKYIKIEKLPAMISPHILVGGGSYKKTNKKNILGKERCIYKKSGDRKEYIKYKGNFIAVREYKKLLKTR